MTTLTPQKPAIPQPGSIQQPRRTTAPATEPRPAQDPAWRELVDAVREAGQYRTRSEAESVTRIVLSALGGHVVGDERVDLARALPEEAARVVASQIPATRQLTASEFVDSVAARIEGATCGDGPLGRQLRAQRPAVAGRRRAGDAHPRPAATRLRAPLRQGGADTGGVTTTP